MATNDDGSSCFCSQMKSLDEIGCFNNQSKKGEFARQTPLRQPRNLSNAVMTESFLAAERNKLSMKEISKALDDVHCVGEELKENAGMIEQSLKEFDVAALASKTATYDIAVAQSREFVESKEFRLKFLRANLYDVQRSVRQMMEFLKCKALYFGEDKVARDILLSDLSQAEVDLLTSGLFHVQQGSDRSGRIVVYLLTHLLHNVESETLIRAMYYFLYDVLLRLPGVQTKGMVGIYYDTIRHGQKMSSFSFTQQVATSRFGAAIPYRHSSMHICLKPGKAELNDGMVSFIMKHAFPEYSRVRTKLHYGSDMELHYHLLGHGIPMKHCPVNSSGEVRRDIMSIWFEKHVLALRESSMDENDDTGAPKLLGETASEIQVIASGNIHSGITANEKSLFDVANTEPNAAISQNNNITPMFLDASKNPSQYLLPVDPDRQDVLFGRGKLLQQHPGNMRFREWLESYRDAYEATPKSKKRSLATSITLELVACGVRFLKQNEHKQWVRVESMEVEEKICQLFRSRRKTV